MPNPSQARATTLPSPAPDSGGKIPMPAANSKLTTKRNNKDTYNTPCPIIRTRQ